MGLPEHRQTKKLMLGVDSGYLGVVAGRSRRKRPRVAFKISTPTPRAKPACKRTTGSRRQRTKLYSLGRRNSANCFARASRRENIFSNRSSHRIANVEGLRPAAALPIRRFSKKFGHLPEAPTALSPPKAHQQRNAPRCNACAGHQQCIVAAPRYSSRTMPVTEQDRVRLRPGYRRRAPLRGPPPPGSPAPAQIFPSMRSSLR